MNYAISILEHKILALESDLKGYLEIYKDNMDNYDKCADVIRFRANLLDCQEAIKVLKSDIDKSIYYR